MNKDQLKKLEADLWSAADKLRANSDLKSSEYSIPVLGLIFLKFADNNYRRNEAAIHAEYAKLKSTRREKKISDIAIEKCGFYLPDHARYEYLLNLPEEKDIAKAIKAAMKAVEEYKPELDGVLPKDEYFRLTRDEKTKTIPNQLLKIFADIPANTTGDLFGQIYEYFLSEFARSEGQKGGEFFTPRSVVRLMVEIIEPHGGKVFDPACGSGGMFVQSAHFIAEHRKELRTGEDSGVFVYGQEKTMRAMAGSGWLEFVGSLENFSSARPVTATKYRLPNCSGRFREMKFHGCLALQGAEGEFRILRSRRSTIQL